ncbi:hypothetical protein M5E06_32920 [Azospirillum sp. A1-3]|uniref:hypothetical protein n=1 Tax=Azospirillum sp. A1-3 TaxID=185874 RepID=UPI002076E681|nr:hypothetical protein [Azospirillum sp. A1-3]MCM8738891.1 hypothetical protein [Azospirillum sp. A1-3]
MVMKDWEKRGFGQRPEIVRQATGLEIVYRVYGGGHRLYGSCYFASTIAGIQITDLTADRLEMELNAALWGNNFQYIAKFRIMAGTKYEIGPIAQSYRGEEELEKDGRKVLVPFFETGWVPFTGTLRQVVIHTGMKQSVADCLQLLEDRPLAAGRFAREAMQRAARFTQ